MPRRAATSTTNSEPVKRREPIRASTRLALTMLFALLLWAGAGFAIAQVLRFENLSQEDGLTMNHVTAFLQDEAGFLWIATQDGLNRYDGYEVRRFRPDGTSQGLQNGVITALARGTDGQVWVGTRQGGVSRWDPRSEQFTTWLRSDDPDHNAVFALLANPDGTLLVGNFAGLDLLDPRDGSFRRVAEGAVRFLARDRHGDVLVIGRRGSLSRIDAAGNLQQIDTQASRIHYAALDETGRLWAGAEDGSLLVRQQDTQELKPLAGLHAGSEVSAMLFDRNGKLWIATTTNGLFWHDPSSGETHHFRSDMADRNSLPSNQLLALHEDQSGVLWVGSDQGAARHDPASARFRVFRAAPDGLADDYIWATQADHHGNLWVGTNNGAALYDVTKATWRNFPANPDDPQALLSNQVLAILVDRSGQVWLGGNRGLSRHDPLTNRFESWAKEDLGGPLPSRVFSLLETRAGAVVIGTGSGVVQWRAATRDFVRIGSEQDFPAVFALAEDADAQLWLGTYYNGLSRVDGAGVVEHPFPFEPQQISVTRFDSKNRLWIGTTVGLFRRDSEGAPLRHYRIRDGLPNELIMGVIEDADGRIWISTNEGIVALDPDTHTFQAFTTQDGLPSNEFNQNAVGQTRDGELLFGTPNGLLQFDPRAVGRDTTPPRVALTGFEVLNQAVPISAGDQVSGTEYQLVQSILTTRELVLSHHEKVVSFRFAALHFSAPAAARYRWKLEGWDESWNEGDAQRRSVTYTNLPAGDYRLRVLAANKDAVWSEEGVDLAIRVLPPPWQTWWAYTLYVLFAIGAIAAYVGLRIRGLHQRQRELESLVGLRTAQLSEANAAKSVFLATMSHELRTPLNAVIGFAQLLNRSPAVRGEDREHLGIIRRAGEHLLGLINDVLSLSKIEAGRLSLDCRPFAPRAVFDAVGAMLRPRAERAGLQWQITIDPNWPASVLGDEVRLRQVLVNLLGNALKFTHEGRVSLQAGWQAGRGHFVIEDSGEGIAEAELATLFEAFVQTESGRQSKEGSGLGLVITREIVRLMDGDISVSSEPGKGSRFAFDVALPEAESAATEPDHARVIGVAANSANQAILVADDLLENRLLIVRLLGSIGLRVLEATNGEEAISIWESGDVALILMDLRMPVLDGREATRRIRQREQQQGLPRTPILALTASAFEHERDEILACGADDFLAKPFHESRLFALIEANSAFRFLREDARQTVVALDREQLAGLAPNEVSQLRDLLERGDVDAALVLTDSLQDKTLGRRLGDEIRAFRVDALLDLLEQRD